MASPLKKRRTWSYHIGDKALDDTREEKQLQLKSRFESIFEKYEKDFTGIGDEIDLDTGEIVVDNGHLERMRYERDPGDDQGMQVVDLQADQGSETQSEESAAHHWTHEEIRTHEFNANGEYGTLEMLPQGLCALDDYDELGDFPVISHDGVTEGLGGFESSQDELANSTEAMRHLLEIRKDTLRDENGKPVDRKWFAPPLPKAPRHRPTHRRVTLPLPLRPWDRNIDLGDWQHEASIWDDQPTPRQNLLPSSMKTIDSFKGSKGIAVTAQDSSQWSEKDDKYLYQLKTTTPLPDDRIAQYLGKSTRSVRLAWQRIETATEHKDLSSKNNITSMTVQNAHVVHGAVSNGERHEAGCALPTLYRVGIRQSMPPPEIPNSDSSISTTGDQPRPTEVIYISSDSEAEEEGHSSPFSSKNNDLRPATPQSPWKTWGDDHQPLSIIIAADSGLGDSDRYDSSNRAGEDRQFSDISSNGYAVSKVSSEKQKKKRSREIPDSQPSQAPTCQMGRQSSPSALADNGVRKTQAKVETPGKLSRPRLKGQCMTKPISISLQSRAKSCVTAAFRDNDRFASTPHRTPVKHKIQPQADIMDAHRHSVRIDDDQDDDLLSAASRTPLLVKGKATPTKERERASLLTDIHDCSDDELG